MKKLILAALVLTFNAHASEYSATLDCFATMFRKAPEGRDYTTVSGKPTELVLSQGKTQMVGEVVIPHFNTNLENGKKLTGGTDALKITYTLNLLTDPPQGTYTLTLIDAAGKAMPRVQQIHQPFLGSKNGFATASLLNEPDNVTTWMTTAHALCNLRLNRN